jgi:hypothetical protein
MFHVISGTVTLVENIIQELSNEDAKMYVWHCLMLMKPQSYFRLRRHTSIRPTRCHSPTTPRSYRL